jgi:hypothetical protein
MKEKFLTKNTKIRIQEDINYQSPPPPGLKAARKVHDEDGKINSDALKAISKKLEDYYGDELKELDPIPKVDGDDEVGSDDVDIFSIDALGAGKMSSLEYESEGSEVEKKFQKRVDDLNDTSEYDKTFGTKDGFGETDKPDDTYKKMKKASAEYNKYEREYELPNPLRVKQAKQIKSESKNNKKKKMKRLNFKNKFNTEYEMLQLIPENYKTDGNIFLMSDSNQTYKVRWDETLKEGTVLNYRNNKMINENTDKMKKLYNYKYSDQNKKTNDYLTESQIMRKMMDAVKGKTLINEQEDVEVTNTEVTTDTETDPNFNKQIDSDIIYTTTIGGQNVRFVFPAVKYKGKLKINPQQQYTILSTNVAADGSNLTKSGVAQKAKQLRPKKGEETVGMAYQKWLKMIEEQGIKFPQGSGNNPKFWFDKFFNDTKNYKTSYAAYGGDESYTVNGWNFLVKNPRISYDVVTNKPLTKWINNLTMTSPNGTPYTWKSKGGYRLGKNLLACNPRNSTDSCKGLDNLNMTQNGKINVQFWNNPEAKGALNGFKKQLVAL